MHNNISERVREMGYFTSNFPKQAQITSVRFNKRGMTLGLDEPGKLSSGILRDTLIKRFS